MLPDRDPLDAAQRNQRHLARESIGVDSSEIPADIRILIADCAAIADPPPGSEFLIHGIEARWKNPKEAWWYAILEGNGICLESLARESGFPRAFCGAPSRCALRALNAEEYPQKKESAE